MSAVPRRHLRRTLGLFEGGVTSYCHYLSNQVLSRTFASFHVYVSHGASPRSIPVENLGFQRSDMSVS
jgi:hypothetical protein